MKDFLTAEARRAQREKEILPVTLKGLVVITFSQVGKRGIEGF
jgi:hypothetical protein